MLKAAADAEARGWKLSEEKNGWYLDQLKAEGHERSSSRREQLTADLRKVGNYMLGRSGCARPATTARRSIDALPRACRSGTAPMRRCARPRSTTPPRMLAALFLVGTLVMVLLGIVGRLLELPRAAAPTPTPATAWPAAGFLALAHTLKRGEHIRVTLVLEHAGAAAQARLERWSLARRDAAVAARSPGTACGSPGSRGSFNDISTGNDATPLWIPQLAMAAGTSSWRSRSSTSSGRASFRRGARRAAAPTSRAHVE